MKVNFICIIMISGKKQGTQYEIHFKKKLKVNIAKGLTIILYMILQYINGTGYTGYTVYTTRYLWCPIQRQHCRAGVQWTLFGEGMRGTGDHE